MYYNRENSHMQGQVTITTDNSINTLKCQFDDCRRFGEMENLMKRKFVQIAALCFAFALIMSFGAAAAPGAAAVSGGQILRVGLYYGSDALDGANLSNSMGSGFRFGYYDSSNQFIALAYTEQTAISVVKTENVYYGTGTVDGKSYDSYFDYLTGSPVAVGCYHLQLPGVYASFEEAKAYADQYAGGFVACIGGRYYARAGSYTDRVGAETAQAELAAAGVASEIAGTTSYGVSVVITGTNTILFQYDDQGAGTGLGVQPDVTGGIVKPVTWFKNIQYYGGFRYERVNGGDLIVVNMVDLEDYVKGVVPHEMSNSWPIEALKAQAVAARSYAMVNLNRHSSYHFDICCTAECQAYSGLSRAGSNSDAAVDSTAGVLAYYNGKVASTFYYSSNGGTSESSSVVWGSSQSNYPYLLGVQDPYEATVESQISGYRWTLQFTGADLASRLQAKGYQCGTITSVNVKSYSDMGNPKEVTFTDIYGKSYSINTRTVYSMLGLRSYHYSFGDSGDTTLSINGGTTVDSTAGLYALDGNGNLVPVSGSAYVITGSGTSQIGAGSGGGSGSNGVFTVTGAGWGHNVGMSQWGAYAMAKQGYTYDQILKFYYTGITVG